ALKSDTIRPSSDRRQALNSATIRRPPFVGSFGASSIRPSSHRQALKSDTIRPSSYRQLLKAATIRRPPFVGSFGASSIRPSSHRQALKSATIRRPPFVGSFGASSIPNLLRSHGYGTRAPALGEIGRGSRR
ncbi:hypothetical protein CF319_g9384, partial [Tilletia indica]